MNLHMSKKKTYLDSRIAWNAKKEKLVSITVDLGTVSLSSLTFLFTTFWGMKTVNFITFCQLNQAPTNHRAIN